MGTFVHRAAESVDVSISAFQLFVTLLAGYVFALIYRLHIYRSTITCQYSYFALSGFGLMVFNYGTDTYHSLISMLIIYTLLYLIPGTMVSVVLAWIILFTHLLIGYTFTATGEYDISWALPQCILTLRLIGLVWDRYDGSQPADKLSQDQKKTALTESPDLLEIAAYTYFFGSFLVGPQYPLVRLRSLVNGEFNDPVTREPRNCVIPCLKRFGAGIFYMALHFYFFPKWPTEYFLSREFQDEALYWKCIHATLWLRFIFCRYIACWLVTEGSCILSGLAYNGKNTKTGEDLWNGVRNIRLTVFELGCTFQSLIDSFNINTNQWAAKYVFKRLKFLGNKTVSHLLTLAFLAIWHGMYSGYFVCFFFEFICIIAERQAARLVKSFPTLDYALNQTLLFYPGWVVNKFLSTFGCAFGFLAFILLFYERWWQVYQQFYFIGWLVYGIGWQAFFYVMRQMFTIVDE